MHRSWAQEYVDADEERLASPLGKQRLTERKTYIEGTFGLAKELHGLRRTRFRGRRRVQIELWLTAAAMNIKQAVQAGNRNGLPFFIRGLLGRPWAHSRRHPASPMAALTLA